MITCQMVTKAEQSTFDQKWLIDLCETKDNELRSKETNDKTGRIQPTSFYACEVLLKA